MKTMRQAYEEYRDRYAPMVVIDSHEERVLRGAFSAGVMFGLDASKVSPADALAWLDAIRDQLDEFWRKEEAG